MAVKCENAIEYLYVVLYCQLHLGIRSIPGGSHDILLPLGSVFVL